MNGDIAPYAICCVQGSWHSYGRTLRGMSDSRVVMRRNLEMMCDYIDACFGIGAQRLPVKLICFPEFSLSGHYNYEHTTDDIKSTQAVTIPGPETDVLAAKAKQYATYIAAVNLENDPLIPNNFFNTAFIINPEGKIILKYRKLNAAFGCSPHDVYDTYLNPVTGKRDCFPVVDTNIGRLSCFICGDLGMAEIPKIYTLKGADILLHLSSGYSWEVAMCQLRARAVDNTIYVVHENWAEMVVSVSDIDGQSTPSAVDTRGGGNSAIIDFTGEVTVQAQSSTPQLLIGMVDVMRLRRERKLWRRANPLNPGGNFLALTRTELYAPYYDRTIYPPNQLLDATPAQRAHDASAAKRRHEALDNLEAYHDFYSETDV